MWPFDRRSMPARVRREVIAPTSPRSVLGRPVALPESLAPLPRRVKPAPETVTIPAGEYDRLMFDSLAYRALLERVDDFETALHVIHLAISPMRPCEDTDA
jgi:hypothetical protein